ncbi:MAG: arginine deiminase-related protein [Cyclobacteriaceae bacterium]|nr:arginine deiminase-related protein [Cyclobacteriaceae bacterium]
MTAQLTDTILMIRPVCFNYNEQTAVNNYYQKALEIDNASLAQENALKEFDVFVEKLKTKGIDVIVVEDTLNPVTPDSIFPNNWISFHSTGEIAMYPMFAENRRLERRKDIPEVLQTKYNYSIEAITNFSKWENEDVFLEGTGSMVLDRENKVAYAALSQRTNLDLLKLFCDKFDYSYISFQANQTVDEKRVPIYHTNVMMCIADEFVVICLDAIDNVDERELVIESFEEYDKVVVEITEEQISSFAGNMLQVKSKEGRKFLIMSSSAYNVLEENQIEVLSDFCEIIHSPLDTIETLGGGSARCMMAEVFLPKNN